MKLAMQRTRMSLLAARRLPPVAITTLVAAAMLIGTSTAEASTPDERCQHSRYKAAARYIVCHQKGMAEFFTAPTPPGTNVEAVSDCRVKYATAWAGLRACDNTDNARFKDNGDGTVADRLTMLQWEKKTDDATVHDVDNVYSWSAGGGDPAAADGTAFTSFLATLNIGGCFAGHCDWRLPTIAELQTILPEPYPCTTSPCIDQAMFGPTVADYYWSDTPLATDPTDGWSVFFGPGSVDCSDKGSNYHVRAVRGGL